MPDAPLLRVTCHTCATDGDPETVGTAETRLPVLAEYARAVHAAKGHDVEVVEVDET